MIFGIKRKIDIKIQPKFPEDIFSSSEKQVDLVKEVSDARICQPQY